MLFFSIETHIDYYPLELELSAIKVKGCINQSLVSIIFGR